MANNVSYMKEGFTTVLTPHFKNYGTNKEINNELDELNQPIEFDVLSAKSVSTASNITEYPMINGDTVADHMIRQPISITLTGKFSLYGNKPFAFIGSNDRLTNIETFFERLKNEGVMCSIVTRDRGPSSSQRFKVRENMVLTNIRWTEQQASLDFDLTFTEALLVNMTEPVPEYTDENLPAITDPAALDFTDTLLDMSKVDEIVINMLRSLELITDDFLKYVLDSIEDYTSGDSSAFVVGLSTSAIAGLGVALVALSNIPVAGWIATAIIAGVGFIVGGIWDICKSALKHYREKYWNVKTFQLSKDSKKNQQELVRFLTYINNIHKQISYLNDVMQVYGIGSNQEQECMFYIDNNYFIFTFKKNNVASTQFKTVWSCSIESANGYKDEIPDISARALKTITECTTSNMIFRTQTSSGYWVYLINTELFTVENADYPNSEARNKSIMKCESNLTSYKVFVSQADMTNFSNKLADIVVDAMKK